MLRFHSNGSLSQSSPFPSKAVAVTLRNKRTGGSPVDDSESSEPVMEVSKASSERRANPFGNDKIKVKVIEAGQRCRKREIENAFLFVMVYIIFLLSLFFSR